MSFVTTFDLSYLLMYMYVGCSNPILPCKLYAYRALHSKKNTL